MKIKPIIPLFSFIVILALMAACAPSSPNPGSSTDTVPLTGAATAVPSIAATLLVSATTAPVVELTETAAPAASSQTQVFKIVPDESTVQYEVAETFLRDNRLNVAVGTTGQISGEIQADLSSPPATVIGPITVDISKFKSDSGQRDNMIRRNFLESSCFPEAVFTPTAIEGLPASYVEGQDYSFKVTGDLKVKDVTKPVTFDVNAQLKDNTLTGQAVTTVLMSDFGVGPISLMGMLNTEDQVKITLKFVARP